MQKFKLRLGKAMIALSIILICIGIYVDINTKNNLSSNKNKIDNKISKNHDIIISTVDSKEKKANNSNKILGEDDLRVVNPLDIAIRDLKNKINEAYGVNVFYGDDILDYVVGGFSIELISDMNILYSTLVQLDELLSLYPAGMFKEINSHDLPLNIYLIQKFSASNITGITEKNKKGVIISIAIDYPFIDSFNHEVYHYMEHYITKKGGKYSNWNNYNPSGFIYGNYDDKYVYSHSLSDDAFFVNDYAQSYDYEDRASTFEFMMADNKIGPLNKGNNIWLKARVICETIDYYFSTVSSKNQEYWERFVYN